MRRGGRRAADWNGTVHPTRYPGYSLPMAQPFKLPVVPDGQHHVAVLAFQHISVGGDVGMLSAVSSRRLAVDELIAVC